MDKAEKAALDAARERMESGSIITLSSGVRVRLRGIASGLLESVMGRIPDPPVPMQFVEDKGKELANPFDPAYLRAVEDANRKRNSATLDAAVLMGFELVDGVPPDETWLPRLRFLEKLGDLDLSGYDLKDPLTREFVFKRYIAVASEEVPMAMDANRIRKEAVEQAARSFPGDEARSADTGQAGS